ADTLGNDAWRIVAMGFDRGCRVRGPAIRAAAMIAQADRAAVAAPAGAAAYGHRYARRQREGVAAIAAPSAYGLCQHGGAVPASRRDSAQVIKNHTRAVAASGPGAAHANDAFAVAAAAAAAADRLHDDADGRVAGGRDGSRIAHHHVTAGRPGGTRRIASHAEQARSAARGAASAADGLTHHAVRVVAHGADGAGVVHGYQAGRAAARPVAAQRDRARSIRAARSAAAGDGLRHHAERVVACSVDSARSSDGDRARVAAIAAVAPLAAQYRDKVAAGATAAADRLRDDARSIHAGCGHNAVALRGYVDGAGRAAEPAPASLPGQRRAVVGIAPSPAQAQIGRAAR